VDSFTKNPAEDLIETLVRLTEEKQIHWVYSAVDYKDPCGKTIFWPSYLTVCGSLHCEIFLRPDMAHLVLGPVLKVTTYKVEAVRRFLKRTREVRTVDSVRILENDFVRKLWEAANKRFNDSIGNAVCSVERRADERLKDIVSDLRIEEAAKKEVREICPGS